MLRIIFWTLTFIFFKSLVGSTPFAYAKANTTYTLESGIAHFESGEYSLALIAWYQLLQDPIYANSEEVLYNLALTEYHLKDYGSSLAHLRQAQALNPISFKIHKTIGYVKKAIETKDYYQVSSEPYFKTFLQWLPKFFFLLLFVLCLGAGTLVASRQRSEGIKFWDYFKSYIYFLALALIPLGLLYLQIKIQSESFATLTGTKSIPLFTSKSTKAPELGQLKVGDAFKILQTEVNSKQNWLAITTPDIPFGWIRTGSYILYRGKIDPKDSRN